MELEQVWTDAKAEIDAANEARRITRDKARKAGVPSPEKITTPEVSEQVAFEALKTATEAAASAKATAESTEVARVQAETNFRAVTAEKIAQIRRDESYWTRRLEAVTVEPPKPEPPKVKKLVGSSIVPRKDFDSAQYSGELGQVLTHLGKMVEANAKEPFAQVSTLHSGNLGKINNAVTAASMQQVGRSVGVYLFILELLGRAFGSPWHVSENVRLFDQLRSRMVWDTAEVGGRSFSLWRPRSNWKNLESFDSGPNGSIAIRNDKELNLFIGTFGSMVARFFELLGAGQKEFAERAEWGLEACLRLEYFMALLGGGTLRGYTDRVQHPYLSITLYLHEQARIAERFPDVYERIVTKLHKEFGSKGRDILHANASGRMAWCDAEVKISVIAQEDEMGPVTQTVDGKPMESFTWAVNVLAATPERLRNAGDSDGPQPLVYVKLMQTLLMNAGLYGLGMFASADFQRKLANTQYAATQPAPLKVRFANDDAWYEPFNWVNHMPIDKRVVDSQKEGAKSYTFKTKNGGKNRTLVNRPHRLGGEHEYFELAKNRWGAEVGPSLMFGTLEHVEYSRIEWGTPEAITARGDSIGWVAGAALREGISAGLFTWD